MSYIPSGNSTNQSNGDVSASGTPIPFLGVFGAIFGLFLAFFIFCLVKLRYRNRRPQRDVEAAKIKMKKTVDLQTLNNANPSQKYEAVNTLKQSTWASTPSSSAELCAICLEMLVDQDDVRQFKCKHVFHTRCIDSWFQKHHVDCPLCKSIFIPNRRGNLEDVH
ncbi:hypothetical protein B0T10DRAFT_233030 [Thelonectria olida]|uniref:RING-type domain-containing protein n=1 Tax=Thelonectria olida TaxID=1576542 RepID=A0A9P8VV67_9HYPO|nr:hypothetical protein B0T10DRAFT_233030 [Thelonectria olida]